MKDVSTLSTSVRSALESGPNSYELAAKAFDLIERSVAPLGGVAQTGVVLPSQLERFKRSLRWQVDFPGRRMTVSEAMAFVDRLARAAEAAAAGACTIRRGRPVGTR
jgi:hypothetical protein